jgi:hypothetical protein
LAFGLFLLGTGMLFAFKNKQFPLRRLGLAVLMMFLAIVNIFAPLYNWFFTWLGGGRL